MVDWKSLAVLSVSGKIPNQIGWTNSDNIFPAETCARHVYVGQTQSFHDIPQALKKHPKTKIYHGDNAYKFLIELYIGLQSMKGLFDQHVSGQVRESWKRYVADQPQQHKILTPYMDGIFHDGSLIKTTLKPFQRHPKIINTAIEMANLSPEKDVLVVCGSEATSVEVITALGTKKAINPDNIFLTHPDEEILANIYNAVNLLQYRNAIKADLHFVPMNEALSTTILHTNAVMVCQPMVDKKTGVNSQLVDINDSICNAWKKRCKSCAKVDSKIIHLKGDPYARGATVGVWLEFAYDNNFIPFTTIKEENSQRIAFIISISKKAKEAVNHMAELRINGDRIRALSFNVETMELSYTVPRRPLGAEAKLLCQQNG